MTKSNSIQSQNSMSNIANNNNHNKGNNNKKIT